MKMFVSVLAVVAVSTAQTLPTPKHDVSLFSHLLKLQQTVAVQSTKLKGVSLEIGSINSNVEKNRIKMDKLERKNEKLFSAISKTTATANKTTAILETTISEMNKVQASLQEKEKKLLNLSRSIAKLQTDVAYEAILSRHINNLPNHQFLRFPNVLYNRGGGYNKNTGIFTAPVSGTYMFWAHIKVNDKGDLTVLMYMDGVEIGRGYTPGNLLDGTGSISTVTHVDQGRRIWLSKIGSYRINGDNYSSFGGALLRSH